LQDFSIVEHETPLVLPARAAPEVKPTSHHLHIHLHVHHTFIHNSMIIEIGLFFVVLFVALAILYKLTGKDKIKNASWIAFFSGLFLLILSLVMEIRN